MSWRIERVTEINKKLYDTVNAYSFGGQVGLSANQLQVIENAPNGEWSRHYFPSQFYRPFTFYQNDFWNWENEIALKSDEKARPRIECEPRGVGKSTCARAFIVKRLARKLSFYTLYICATDNQAQKHYNAIRAMLESDKLLTDYPHLKPQAQKHRPNVNKSWSSERLVTAVGQVVEFISLLGNARGFTTEEGKRPDLMVLDDIDDSKDSPYMVDKKLEILKYSIIPARARNTVIIFPQNLIHRNSVCQKIKDQRADILNDRIFVGAYPLCKWYDAQKVELNDGTGAMRWTITDGEPLDNVVPLTYCEELLNEMGKDAFDRECQQDVFKVADDKDFREWNEVHHIITYTEFYDYFGDTVWNDYRAHPQIPHNWNVGLGFDWGTTKNHPSVIASVARPNQYAPLNNCFFVFSETVLPKYPLPTHETAQLVSPGRVVTALKADLALWNITDQQIKRKLMSHEASAALNTMAIDLQDDLKEYFNKWRAEKGSGVPQIQNLLEIDQSKPHPFRRNPSTGELLRGCPRLFFIVPDEQGALRADAHGNLFVAQPTNHHGFTRARFEMPIYSHLSSGQHKIDDDFVDAFRGLMNSFGIASKSPTKEERAEKDLEQKGLGQNHIDRAESEEGKMHLAQQRALEKTRIAKERTSYKRVGTASPFRR